MSSSVHQNIRPKNGQRRPAPEAFAYPVCIGPTKSIRVLRTTESARERQADTETVNKDQTRATTHAWSHRAVTRARPISLHLPRPRLPREARSTSGWPRRKAARRSGLPADTCRPPSVCAYSLDGVCFTGRTRCWTSFFSRSRQTYFLLVWFVLT